METSSVKNFFPVDSVDPINPAALGEKGVISSADLFGSETAVWIRHEKVLYRLMKTRQGKLILTK